MMSEGQLKPILVNGEEVSDALIGQELQMLRERYARAWDPQEMERQRDRIESDARENAVERVLLMQKARAGGAEVHSAEVEARWMALKEQHGGEEEFRKRFELGSEDETRIKRDIENNILLEKYFDEICKEVARPGEADSQAYYDEHKNEFLVSESVHAAHIVQHPSPENPLEKVYAELLNVRERLKSGEDFETLARAYSHCGDGGYDLGYFSRGQMVQAFEDRAFATPVGECSDVFQSEFGYHILKVFDRKPEALRDFKDVRYDIEAMLFEERKNEAIGVVVDALRGAADIQNLKPMEGQAHDG